ncbi:putative sodium-coupled neutral amino acid transporter 10 [Nasonia vitripennis]|uniref:Amino acid transporter transmembrane domain-containing protein n=1 Tax=Nasonia vitripennis TaxID=7425 RepID=A0A7M7G2J6_NASVI|nr:putative sodium-coupled neutral amino acid transporter 10 [Nasonia vitripennis]
MISHIMTLANGIIGVSVLAMPFCFKQCGIVLATLVLLLSSILSRLACHFLIKSAVMCRRRNFEFLAFHAFGPMAKILVELCIIGFLLGTCIAFFVVVGDLGPQIVGEMINKNPGDIRTSFLITTGIFIVLPLGLLRNIDSLASVSTASIAFYICLVFKVIAESTHHIFAADWFDKVDYWRPAGILQCLPIFALALFCQTQLFEIYEAMPNATLEKMNQVVKGALNICTTVYISVGFFGYVAFCTQPFTGNILMSFEPNLTSEIIKIGFVLSVAFSFPLVIFPCRASLNSLLFRRGYAHETTTSYITEARFRCLTTFIVIIALTIGVLIPNIELVLGIVGSTIGVIICLIFPAAFFISINTKNTNERLLAQILVFTGVWIMILGTYANLYAIEQSSNSRVTATTMKLPSQINNMPHSLINKDMLHRPDQPEQSDILIHNEVDAERLKPKVPDKLPDDENVRQEPPVPVERVPETEKLKIKQEPNIFETVTISPKIQEIVDKINNMDNELIKETNRGYDSLKKTKETNELPKKIEDNSIPVKDNDKTDTGQKNDVIAVDAIKKEDSELAADKEMSNVDSVQRREQLEKTLKKHLIEQKEMLQEQKELLKDIEQQKKELQLDKKPEIVKENKKNEMIKENAEEHIGDELRVPIKANQVNVKADQVNEKLNNNQDTLQTKLEMLGDGANSPILKSKDILLEVENSDKNEGIQNNEIPNNEKPIKNEQLDNINGPNSNRNSSLVSNLNDGPDNVLIKKSEDPIIKALTRQSNKIANGNEVIDIPSDDRKINVNLNDKKVEDKVRDKNDKYSIPIVLKMNNQTKLVLDSEHSSINKSSPDVAGVGRDILEEHQREKRTISLETDTAKLNHETNSPDGKSNAMIEHSIVDKEICTKDETKSENSNLNVKTEPRKSTEEPNFENLIKTSAYLSEQNIVKRVLIDPDLNLGNNHVKLKKRDLKTLDFNEDSKK